MYLELDKFPMLTSWSFLHCWINPKVQSVIIQLKAKLVQNFAIGNNETSWKPQRKWQELKGKATKQLYIESSDMISKYM